MRNTIHLPLLAILMSLGACGGPAKPAGAATTPRPTEKPKIQLAAEDDTAAPVVSLSMAIRERCGIAQEATYFDYNSVKVSQQIDSVLKQVVVCFTTGPLSGESLSLVGRADPRGDEEYNYLLGERRAVQVRSRLHQLGLPDAKATTTSRGESGALGHDSQTWAADRRVDLEIGSAS